MFDLALAIGHHLLVFALVGVLVYEIAAVREGMGADDVARVGRVDLWYGILAVGIIVVGFSRAIFAAKGWAYYGHNLFFWAKIAAFLIVGALSIHPTIMFIRWRAAARTELGFAPAATAVGAVRRTLWAEVGCLAFVPVFAAAMARGYGSMV